MGIFEPRTILLTVHVAALVLGLGAAVVLDLHLLRVLRGGRALRALDLELLGLGERLAALGLVVLWLSGAGLVALAVAADPAALENPKLLAKILIVAALTANGLMLHARVLPRVRAGVGAPLFARMGAGDVRLALAGAAVSATGWGAAFLLGMLRELNGRGSVGLYLALWAAAAVAAACVAGLLRPAAARSATVGRQLLPL